MTLIELTVGVFINPLQIVSAVEVINDDKSISYCVYMMNGAYYKITENEFAAFLGNLSQVR